MTRFELPELNKGRFGNILLITASDPDHPLAADYNTPAVTIQFGGTIIPSNQTIHITSTKLDRLPMKLA